MENLTISDKQRHAIGLLENPSAVEIFMGGSGGGPQPLDAIVKTPAGDRAIGDLEVGDKVLTYNGDIQEVIDIPYEGKGLVFEITLESGRKVQAEENHLFPFKLARNKRPELLKVKDYVYSLDSWKEENQPELYVSENGKIWSEKIASYKLIGDSIPVRCISVSNLDGLYLTNDFIVTHNSKTFTMAIMVLLTIRQYPGCRLFVGRKTLKSLRQSFIQTLLGQVHKMFNLVEDQDFNYSAQLGEIKYNNGSTVIFGELMKNPSDPDFSRFGSLELDMAFIEEAGEVTLEAKNAIRSRVGRGIMAKEHSLPGKLVLSGNPSQNFLRTEYYDPYMELGGGEYQSWVIGETVIRPDKKKVPKKVPMKRCFLRMSVYQNPFIPQSYIDTLKTLPRRERKRLLDGDWDYADDDSSLFKSGLIDKAITYELPQSSENFNKVIGVDVSDAGRDRTVFSLIDNGVLVTQKCSNVQMNWDRKSEEPLSYLIANELIEFAQRNGFQQVNAKNIAVESNGVGVGVRDALRVRGWTLTEYVNTGQSRSDNYYNLMLNMDSGTIKLYKDVSTLGELRKELGAHTYEMENQEPKVIKKSKLKETLGRSPDYSDSFMIASWMWDRKVNPQRDPKRNSKRISW